MAMRVQTVRSLWTTARISGNGGRQQQTLRHSAGTNDAMTFTPPSSRIPDQSIQSQSGWSVNSHTIDDYYGLSAALMNPQYTELDRVITFEGTNFFANDHTGYWSPAN